MKKKILVIDDQEELLELTSRVLQSRGYDVITLSDGENAIAVIKKESPQLVLMDMLMPGKDGAQVCQEMKSDSAIRNIPVILTTGQMLDESEYSQEGLSGANDYLKKPFELDELLSKIEKFLPKDKA